MAQSTDGPSLRTDPDPMWSFSDMLDWDMLASFQRLEMWPLCFLLTPDIADGDYPFGPDGLALLDLGVRRWVHYLASRDRI